MSLFFESRVTSHEHTPLVSIEGEGGKGSFVQDRGRPINIAMFHATLSCSKEDSATDWPLGMFFLMRMSVVLLGRSFYAYEVSDQRREL